MNVLRPGAEVAEAAWAELVRANREQVQRLRERSEQADFWEHVSPVFRADPRRTDDPVLAVLQGLARRGERWLDVGAGGGRFALPLALQLKRVIAVEPSPSMRGVLREGMAEHGIGNIDVIEGRWEEVEAPVADVALIAHLGYDVEQPGPFLRRLERHARRLCVAVLLDRQPASIFGGLWEEVFGEPQRLLPALGEFITLQLAREKLVEARLVETEPWSFATREEALDSVRWRLWLIEGSERDRALQRVFDRFVREVNGRWRIPGARIYTGIVTWAGEAESSTSGQ